MSKIKLFIIGFIIGGIIIGPVCIYCVKKYWPSVEIGIKRPKISPTIYTIPVQDMDINKPGDCEIIKKCAVSKLNVKLEAKENKIFGRAWDDCKYIDFEFGLNARSTDRHIFQIGAGWIYDIGYYIRPGYLYRTCFWDIAIGGSILINKTNPGGEITFQKSF